VELTSIKWNFIPPIYELWRDVILVVTEQWIINEAHVVIAKSLKYSVESFFNWGWRKSTSFFLNGLPHTFEWFWFSYAKTCFSPFLFGCLFHVLWNAEWLDRLCKLKSSIQLLRWIYCSFVLIYNRFMFRWQLAKLFFFVLLLCWRIIANNQYIYK